MTLPDPPLIRSLRSMTARALRPRMPSPAVARGNWLTAALLTVGLFSASLPARYSALLHPADSAVRARLARLGLSVSFYAAYHIGLEACVALGFFAVAIVIFLRRPDDWTALFVSLTLVTFGAALPGTMYALVSGQPIWDVPYGFLQGLGWCFLLLFAYLFPDGRFVPRMTRYLAVIWALWVAAFFLFARALAASRPWLIALTFVVWVGWFGTGTLAQLYRYVHAASPTQRQQTSWVVLGFLAAIFGTLVAVIPHIIALSLPHHDPTSLIYQLAATAVLSITVLAIPLSIGIAILRHQLFDIDVITNRTLVYGTLTGLLALIYFAGVTTLQLLVSAFSGHLSIQVSQSPSAIVLSTLLIAAVFQPLRRRLQATIDWRFYRRKYDVARTLEAFSAALRTETDLARLNERLVAVVRETMQPVHVSLWLRPPARQKGPGSAGAGTVEGNPPRGGWDAS
jgi:hypothetical protein